MFFIYKRRRIITETKDVKTAFNTHVKLKDNSADYLFTGYILRRIKNKFIHQAELLDVKNGNSVVIAALEDVEPQSS